MFRAYPWRGSSIRVPCFSRGAAKGNLLGNWKLVIALETSPRMHSISHREATSGSPHLLIVGAVVNFVFLSVLGLLTLLREQPLFWRNAGGWPIWLREFVEISFYPLLVLELMLLMTFSSVCARCLGPRCSSRGSAILMLTVLWVLFFCVVAVIGANNLENLLSGRPVHWHAD